MAEVGACRRPVDRDLQSRSAAGRHLQPDDLGTLQRLLRLVGALAAAPATAGTVGVGGAPGAPTSRPCSVPGVGLAASATTGPGDARAGAVLGSGRTTREWCLFLSLSPTSAIATPASLAATVAGAPGGVLRPGRRFGSAARSSLRAAPHRSRPLFAERQPGDERQYATVTLIHTRRRRPAVVGQEPGSKSVADPSERPQSGRARFAEEHHVPGHHDLPVRVLFEDESNPAPTVGRDHVVLEVDDGAVRAEHGWVLPGCQELGIRSQVADAGEHFADVIDEHRRVVADRA